MPDRDPILFGAGALHETAMDDFSDVRGSVSCLLER